MMTLRDTRAARRLAAVLLIVVVAVCVGCESSREIRDRYEAERMAWRASSLMRAVSVNPGMNTDEMRARVEDEYRNITRAFPPPEGDSEGVSEVARQIARISGHSRLALGQLAMDRGDFDEARRLYSSVRDSYALERGLAIDATLALGAVERREDRWPEAVAVYAGLIEDWQPARDPESSPDTRILRAPLSVAAVYRARGDAAEAAAWSDRAREYYARWIAEWPESPTAELATSLTAESYGLEDRWEEAARVYEELDRDFGTPENRAPLWLGLAEIYETRLGRNGLAREYYERVESEYGDDVSGATAAVSLARQDLAAGRHDDARRRLSRVIDEFTTEQVVSATAMQYLAMSFEATGNWDRAAAQYSVLAREYPTTLYGLRALIHVSDRYVQSGDEEVGASTLERAVEQYTRVIREYAGTSAEIAARGYLVDARIRQEKWEAAARILLETSELLPDSEDAPIMKLQAADLYTRQLEDFASAREVLEDIASTYAGEPWAEEAARQLEALPE
jgi:TolA-binding protein